MNKKSNKLQFSTGDNKGFITDDGNFIIRSAYDINDKHPKKIFDLYDRFALNMFGVVETEYIAESNQLKHTKLPITYPHEWPPIMLKDALLFYLNLLLQLDKYDLTLKDALPENILFSGITPIFVDFFSIVPNSDLENEKWLKDSCPEGVDLRIWVLQLMFVPYFLIPFLLYVQGDFESGKKVLKNYFCNNSNKITFDWNILSNKCKIFSILKNTSKQIKKLQNLFNNNIPWRTCINSLIQYIETTNIRPPISGYNTYFTDKKEDFGICDTNNWTQKQHTIAKLLDEHKPESVLDIGSNTGWFSLLALKKGAKVFSLDYDVSCVDELYRIIQYTDRNNLTPLWISFDDLFSEEYSLDAYGALGKNPFHISADKRLCSDLVMCLGLFHHLTLGLGKSFSELLNKLLQLCNKILIIEFVDLNDNLIKSDPDFFPLIQQWNTESYSLNNLIELINLKELKYSIFDSFPVSSRHLIAITK